MRRHFKSLAFVLCALPVTTCADPIAGADDPALLAAAQDWLNGDDPAAAIWTIGELAAGGNMAARRFANRLYYRYVLLDFPDLPRQDRRTLFPEDRSGPRRGFMPYRVEDDTRTERIAQRAFEQDQTPENWITLAEALIDAGQADTLAIHYRGAIVDLKSDLLAVSTRFMETRSPEGVELWYHIWTTRIIAHQMLHAYLDEVDPDRAARQRAVWDGDPWPEAVAIRFEAALAEGRWSAIRAAAFGQMFAQNARSDWSVVLDEDTQAIVDLVTRNMRLRPEDRPLEAPAVEISALGAVLIEDATHSPYLHPLAASCALACPDTTAYCVGRGALSSFDDLVFLARLDPVISSDAYYRSDRATREFLFNLGHMQASNADQMARLNLPSCLQDEAKRMMPASRD